LGLNIPESQRSLTKDDIVEIIRHMIMVNNGKDNVDDIDHLGNRRIRTVGELIQNQFRIGLLRLERVAKERMSTIPIEVATPQCPGEYQTGSRFYPGIFQQFAVVTIHGPAETAWPN